MLAASRACLTGSGRLPDNSSGVGRVGRLGRESKKPCRADWAFGTMLFRELRESVSSDGTAGRPEGKFWLSSPRAPERPSGTASWKPPPAEASAMRLVRR